LNNIADIFQAAQLSPKKQSVSTAHLREAGLALKGFAGVTLIIKAVTILFLNHPN